MLSKKSGFSLVEVLVFVTVVSLFFVVAAAVSSFSLQISKTNENKILATRYAEELVEWLRGEKEADWNTFSYRSGNTYCFKTAPINSWGSQGSCNESYDLQNLFDREVTITPTGGDNQLNIAISVTWEDSQNTFEVPIRTVFSRFE